METFPGGKGRSYPHLINLMPPHKVYIEPYLGGGAVVRKKRPSEVTIVADLDFELVNKTVSDQSSVLGFNCDAIELLRSQSLCPDTLVYCDPPYLSSTRRKAKIYKFEYTQAQHLELLHFLVQQTCMVMISGYDNPWYNSILKGWNKTQFNAQTQSGPRTETVWLNYPFPQKLHDSRYWGSDFRERQNRKRRQERLRKKIDTMCPIERTDFIEWVNSSYAGEFEG